MKAHRLIKLPFLASIILMLVVSAFSSNSVVLVEIALKSQLVLLATVVEVNDASVSFDVIRVYRGGELLDEASPRIPVVFDGVSAMRLTRSLPTNRQFVLFLNPSNSGGTFTPVGYVEVGHEAVELETIEHLLETFSNPDERERVDSLVRDFESSDQYLKRLAKQSLLYTVRRSRTPLAYKDLILSFLNSEQSDSNSVGLSMVQGLRVDEAVPRLITMAQKAEPAVLERVSLALREYKTPEVARTLAGLMKHPEPQVRVRAVLDTDHMNEPEVIEGLVALEGDPDPAVRAMLPRGFYFHPTQMWSNAFHPILIRLADDPDTHVRARALHALGDNRCWELIPTKLALERLKRSGLTAEETRGALDCLYVACSNRPEQGSKIVAANEDVLIGLVMREDDSNIGLVALLLLELHPCPKAAAAIDEAAIKQKFSEVRFHAQRLQKSASSGR